MYMKCMDKDIAVWVSIRSNRVKHYVDKVYKYIKYIV